MLEKPAIKSYYWAVELQPTPNVPTPMFPKISLTPKTHFHIQVNIRAHFWQKEI